MSMALNDDQLTKPEESPAFSGLAWVQRIVAVYCLVFGVAYWVRLIGIYDGSLWRFDLMPLHWQLASGSLAALFPVAAIGLWMMSSWGPVLWFAAAAIEVTMHFGFPNLYGFKPAIVATHIGVGILFTAFAIMIKIQKRRKKV